MWPLLLGGTKMKKERKVEALKREIERLKVKNAELESELQNQKEQSQKIIEGLHEQINRYMKADSDKRIRELEEQIKSLQKENKELNHPLSYLSDVCQWSNWLQFGIPAVTA